MKPIGLRRILGARANNLLKLLLKPYVYFAAISSVISESAALAAGIANDHEVAVQDVPYRDLYGKLILRNQKLKLQEIQPLNID